jgi:hypothetical protein
LLALLVAALLVAALALALRKRRGRRPAHAPSLSGIVYLFDQETREARTAILPGDAQRLEVRRRPLRLEALATGEPPDAGIAQIWPTAAGPLIRDAAAKEALPLLHDRPYALAGGAVVLRYRSAEAGHALRRQPLPSGGTEKGLRDGTRTRFDLGDDRPSGAAGRRPTHGASADEQERSRR